MSIKIIVANQFSARKLFSPKSKLISLELSPRSHIMLTHEFSALRMESTFVDSRYLRIYLENACVNRMWQLRLTDQRKTT